MTKFHRIQVPASLRTGVIIGTLVAAFAAGPALAGSYTLTTPVSFTTATGGVREVFYPAGLTQDGQGGFLGTTEGAYIKGVFTPPTIFQYNPAAGVVKGLAYINASQASFESAGQGIFYGTTLDGGQGGYGSIFRFNLATGAVTTLFSFDYTGGRNPGGPLVPDGQGNYLGTTEFGGTAGDGTIFRFNPASGAVTTLANFTGDNGKLPGSLTPDGHGGFLGTTSAGGTAGDGTIYRLDPSTGAVTTLANFMGPNGSGPSGQLVPDGRGNFLGTTADGGPVNAGTIYRLDPSTGAVTTLASFAGTNGSLPSGLVPDNQGDYLGTTRTGSTTATYNGTVFSFNPTTGALTMVDNFVGPHQSDPIPGAIGADPSSVLVPDGHGNFYGTTRTGGTSDLGTIYELSPVPVPEPPSAMLMGVGIAGAVVVAAVRRMRGAGAARS